MKKVYVIEEEWINRAQDEYHEYVARMVAVAKDQLKAEEMCRLLRERMFAQLLSNYPDDKYDLINDDLPSNCIAALSVDAGNDFDSGCFYWRCSPYDLIGS